MTTYEDFYKTLGLISYPFASFTTENETERFGRTFIKPNDYESILDNFSQKNSILLTGDRGTGKTALLKDLKGKVETKNSILCEVVDYSELKIGYALEDFYKFIITNLTIELFNSLADKPRKVNKLDRDEKILLCYLYKNFVPQLSKGRLKEKIKKLQISPLFLFLNNFQSFFRGIFNYGATAGSMIVDEYIARHFSGLPPLQDSLKIKEFFPELPLNVEHEFLSQEISYNLFVRVLALAKRLGFSRVIIMFDRFDEDSRFENDAELISEFIKKILTDNKFLLEADLQIVFSVWVTPFNYIKDNVRTQKHYCPTLVWKRDDLKEALNKRLAAYSNGHVSNYERLFDADVSEEEILEVFSLANSNPRDLWHIFNHLFRSQFDLDSSADKIRKGAISKALTEFVTSFNYYEYYPKKTNARSNSMDIYSYTKHLLKLDDIVFTKNQLNEQAQTGGSTNNYVVGMERIGLICLDSQRAGVAYYRIKDPKIIFALENKLEIKRE